MRILGIDPGSKATGYGLIECQGNRLRHIENGIVAPRSSDALPAKLQTIYRGLEQIIAEFQPEAMAVEQIFVAKNPRSALVLGHARGAAILAGVNANLTIHEYTAMQVKNAVVGYGRAGKQQVQQMVKALLNLPEVAQEDAADALAVSICHANSRTLNQAVAQSGRR
jgi:crossover junction endodeoxyribonuclease RuvC